MTKQTQATPGPWEAVHVGDSGGPNPIDVYEVLTADGHVRVAEYMLAADAKLAAAAPDLLEALLDMVSDHADLSEATLRFARAAITKATGEQQ